MAQLENVRNWEQSQLEAFAESAEEGELVELFSELLGESDDAAIAVLVILLGSRGGSTFEKAQPSQLAARVLLLTGPKGVATVRDALLDDKGRVRYAAGVVRLLWHVGKVGKLGVTTTYVGNAFLSEELPPGTQEAAAQAVGDIFARALEDPASFALVGQFAFAAGLNANTVKDGTSPDAAELMGLFGEASIKLSRAVLDRFRVLMSEERNEEEYQRFLTLNPVLLDPLAAEVIPKQRLGLEYATDYAVRRHDDRWLLVEIERPSDSLFTKRGDFRERFVHAFGQVLDFQSWVDNNVAYAQKHMRSIAAPRGMVVMGLRDRLSDTEKTKLRRFADNSQRIEIHTFDDLLDRAESLYASLRHAQRT